MPEKNHPPENAIDGTEAWWQSPPLSRGMKFNEVNLTINFEQVNSNQNNILQPRKQGVAQNKRVLCGGDGNSKNESMHRFCVWSSYRFWFDHLKLLLTQTTTGTEHWLGHVWSDRLVKLVSGLLLKTILMGFHFIFDVCNEDEDDDDDEVAFLVWSNSEKSCWAVEMFSLLLLPSGVAGYQLVMYKFSYIHTFIHM